MNLLSTNIRPIVFAAALISASSISAIADDIITPTGTLGESATASPGRILAASNQHSVPSDEGIVVLSAAEMDSVHAGRPAGCFPRACHNHGASGEKVVKFVKTFAIISCGLACAIW